MRVFFSNSKFRYLALANFVTLLGTTLFDLSFITYASGAPNPALAIGIVTFISTIPNVTDFIIGYSADQTGKKYSVLVRIKLIQTFLYLIFSMVVGLSMNWVVFGFVVCINFSSDILGRYGMYLTYPILKKIMKSSEITDARSFQTGIGEFIGLLGKLLGATLLALIKHNYVYFGVINACLFFCAFLLLNKERVGYKSIDLAKGVVTQSISEKISSFFVDSFSNLKTLVQMRELFNFTIIFSLMNLVGVAQYTLMPILLALDDSLLVSSFSFSLALYLVIEEVGIMLGALIPTPFLRNRSIELTLVFENLVTFLVLLNLSLFRNVVALLILLLLSGYLLGVANPRIDSFIIVSTPENSISSITSIFYTLVQLVLPIGSGLFALLATSISTDFSLRALLGVSLFVTILALVYFMRYRTIPER